MSRPGMDERAMELARFQEALEGLNSLGRECSWDKAGSPEGIPSPQTSSQPGHLPLMEPRDKPHNLSLSSTGSGSHSPPRSRWFVEPKTWGPRKSLQLACSPHPAPSANPVVLKGPAERDVW